MPESQPNQIARVFAVFALLGAVVLVAFTLATAGGGSSGNGDGDGDDGSGPTKKGQRALTNGVWVVGKGDTLVSISEETGMEIEELINLNPAIDPQVLVTGQRISLRAGAAGEGGSAQEGAGDDGAPPGEGTGVGDGGPTGSGSDVSDDIPSD